jgi:transcriptional regulator CtsR
MELQAAKLIAAALSDRTLASVEQEKRDRLRADLFKNMVITLNN